MAWTRRDRAEDLLLEGELDASRRELAEARRWVDRMPPGVGADRVRADVDLIRAETIRFAAPQIAVPLLDTVAATYRRLTLWVLLPSALRVQALASLQLGDTTSARRHLHEAIAVIEHQSATFESPDRRVAFQETVEGVFDEMVRLELSAGRAVSALSYLERSRLAAWKPPRRRARGRSVWSIPIAEVPRQLADRTVLLDYAVLPDRVVIWVGSGGGWRHMSIPVTRDSIARLANTARGEIGRDPAARGLAQQVLFQLLVAPVWGLVHAADRVAIVPDRELFQVPFAALRDPTTGRRVIEHVEVATLPNARLAVASPPHEKRVTAAIAVNAAASETATGRLPALPGAADEVRRIAKLYRDAMVLTEPDREQLRRVLRTATVFHFAGHAVFDIDQPELSYLLVKSSAGAVELQAREIAEMQLSNVQVAVLSACSSLSARATRNGAVAGLAYSFLSAGVPATVSTLWDVGDGSSVNLMVEFHRGLVHGLSPSASLRQAQVRALRSGEGEESWSAFIYSGPFID